MFSFRDIHKSWGSREMGGPFCETPKWGNWETPPYNFHLLHRN